MDNLNNQCCRLLANPAYLNSTESKPPVKAEINLPMSARESVNKSSQKPWSVFEGVYWI